MVDIIKFKLFAFSFYIVHNLNMSNIADNPTKNWPGAFGIFSESKRSVMLNISTIISCFAISFFASFIIGILDIDNNTSSALMLALGLIITPILTITLINSTRGIKNNIQEAYEIISGNLLNIVLTQVIISIILVASFLFFIIPYFFIAPRLYLVLYYAVDRNMAIGEALSASWKNTKGHVLKVYGMIGFYALSTLLFITLVGIPVSFYLFIMYSASTAIFYNFIENQKIKSF